MISKAQAAHIGPREKVTIRRLDPYPSQIRASAMIRRRSASVLIMSAMRTTERAEQITSGGRMTFYLPISLREGLEGLAHEHERPVTWELRMALEAHIKRHRVKAPRLS